MINWLLESEVAFVVVLTKCDKLSNAQQRTAISELEEGIFKDTGIKLIPFSSVTKQGKDEVWSEIFSKI